MKDCTNLNCRQTNLKVSLGPFARDERLPMVERVLGLLIESRYGLDRKSELLPEFGGALQAAPDVSLDLFPQPFPIPVGRRPFSEPVGSVELHRSRKSVARLADLTNNILPKFAFCSPSNLGRGSPRNYGAAVIRNMQYSDLENTWQAIHSNRNHQNA